MNTSRGEAQNLAVKSVAGRCCTSRLVEGKYSPEVSKGRFERVINRARQAWACSGGWRKPGN